MFTESAEIEQLVGKKLTMAQFMNTRQSFKLDSIKIRQIKKIITLGNIIHVFYSTKFNFCQ